MYHIPLHNPMTGVIFGHVEAWTDPNSTASLTVYQSVFQAGLAAPGQGPPLTQIIANVCLDELDHQDGPYARIEFIYPAQGMVDPNAPIEVRVFCRPQHQQQQPQQQHPHQHHQHQQQQYQQQRQRRQQQQPTHRAPWRRPRRPRRPPPPSQTTGEIRTVPRKIYIYADNDN